MKAYSFSPKAKKGKKEHPTVDNSERLVALKEHVQLIRSDVLTLELQLAKINADADRLKREWTTFLKHILKGGHYLRDGMESVLR